MLIPILLLLVDRKHRKVPLVSMFGPLPDWMVAISGEDLYTADCFLDFDLYSWHNGTYSGITYMSPNLETQPKERMYRIKTMYPEDPCSPFNNLQSCEMTLLTKQLLTREKIILRNCDDDFLQALQMEVSDNSED